MNLKSDKHPCVTLALIASMPRVFESVQDKCITKANCKKDSKSFYVRMTHFYCDVLGMMILLPTVFRKNSVGHETEPWRSPIDLIERWIIIPFYQASLAYLKFQMFHLI